MTTKVTVSLTAPRQVRASALHERVAHIKEWVNVFACQTKALEIIIRRPVAHDDLSALGVALD